VKMLIIVTSLLAVLAIFARGSRFPLGFQLLGSLFFVFQMYKFSFKQLLMGALVIVLITATQGTMRAARNKGIAYVQFGDVVELVLEPESHLSAEGVLRVNGWIHSARAYSLPGKLPDNLFILYWWVPRQVWPEKPTMAGYWLIRELTDGPVNENHSVSGGFSMPALLDFGPVFGVFFCVSYGFWLALFEAYGIRYRNSASPHAILVAMLFFGVFFMMRSLQTSLLFMIQTGLVSVVPLLILYRLLLTRHRPRFIQGRCPRHLGAKTLPRSDATFS
jgi:hypothetical protein